MKKTILSIIAILLLSLSFVSAYDLEVTYFSTQGNLIADNDITFDIVIQNNGELYNSSKYPTNLSLILDDGTSTIIELNENIEANDAKQYTFVKQYNTKGTYDTSISIVNPVGHNDTNLSNNIKELALIIPNSVPVVETISDQETIMDTTFTYQVMTSDADEDSLTYAISSDNINENLAIDTTGLITYSNAVFGNHQITITVSDGEDETTEAFNLNVRADTPSFKFNEETIELDGTNNNRLEQIQKTFTITNDGTQAIANFKIDNNLYNDFETIISFDKVSILNPGESRTGVLFVTIPEDQDSERDIIGSLTITGEATTMNISRRISVALTAKSWLTIENIEIKTSNDEDTSIRNSDKIDFFKEGDVVEITVNVENNYNEDDDLDLEIENIYVEVESNQDWFNDEKSKEIDLDPENDEDITFKVTLDNDIDDDVSTAKFRIYGDDKEFDFQHYDEWELDFEIDRESHEIIIKSVSLVNSNGYENDNDVQTIDCEQNSATMNIYLKNTGTHDEDEVLVRAYSKDLDFSKSKNNIEIDESDTERITFVISTPDNLRNGNLYMYTVKAYYDNDEESDSESFIIKYVCESKVIDEEVEPVVEEENNNQNNNNDFVIDPNIPASSGNRIYSEPIGTLSAFRGTNTYLIILAAIVLILLISTAFVISKVYAKK